MRALSHGVLCGVALLAVSTSISLAADLGVRRQAPAQEVFAPAPVASWTGFYVGANLGYGWGNFDGTVSGFGLSAPVSPRLSGVVGGGQLGYNWQTGPFVFGIEGDIQGTGEHHSETFTALGFAGNEDMNLDMFATIRGRIGVTPWSSGLLYATGGWAWMQGRYTLNAPAFGTLIDSSVSKGGWTLGGGYEQMVWAHWSAKLEYLYTRSDEFTASATLLGVPVSATGRFTNNVVRAGLNYHF
jgi:outer membrane immunogenic protein